MVPSFPPLNLFSHLQGEALEKAPSVQTGCGNSSGVWSLSIFALLGGSSRNCLKRDCGEISLSWKHRSDQSGQNSQGVIEQRKELGNRVAMGPSHKVDAK